MTGNSPEDFVIRNQTALEELAWSIEMAQRQFTLLLARCNYASLRQQIVAQVQDHCAVPIRVVTLPETATTLYTSLKAELGEEQPQAVMVFGLEAVQDLEQMLASINQVREEFRKAFPFPLVLWVTNEVSNQLIRLAPDFHSWSTTTEFLIATDTLLASLRQGSENLFETLLAPNSPLSFTRLWTTFSLGELQRSELESALTDLHDRGEALEPELQASLALLRGLEAGIRPEALIYLEDSLRYWQQAGDRFSLRVGLLLFFLGRYHYYAIEQARSATSDWNPANRPLQQCLDIFEQANRPDLVAKGTTHLERVLEKCQAWEDLEQLAQRSLPLQQRYSSLSRLAQDYRYLAEVALHRSQWQVAQQWAQQAWDTLQQIPEEQRWAGLYCLTMARAEKRLGNQEVAIRILEYAYQLGDQGMPRFYIRILEELRQIYLEQKRYLEAFSLKQIRMSTEQQYGIQAFVGAGWLKPRREEAGQDNSIEMTTPLEAVAPEIAASGRQLDLDKLLQRIGRNDYKLIVVHGLSGVGKSSLVTAGLVPALRQRSIGIQENLPVLIRTYTDWYRELEQHLAKISAEKRLKIPNYSTLNIRDRLLAQLRQNEQRNFRTVLIFDQFEEFFFVFPNPVARQPFFEFLGDCLSIPSVKVILSLREDYLHYLLECSRLSSIATTGIDILSRNVLYGLENFSPADAREIIQDCTHRARYYLELDLVEALVQDLASELEEVRPIELQVVGAQLQVEGITTLRQYQSLGNMPKEELVKRYVAQVVQDCGAENSPLAELILYLLADEAGHRPLKTRPELERDLKLLSPELDSLTQTLDLILRILCSSGIIVHLPENPDDRYQLVHGYLSTFIRQQQRHGLLARLERERKLRSQKEEELKQTLHLIKISQIEALYLSSQALWLSNNQIQALITAIEVGQEIRETEVPLELKFRIIGLLRQIVYSIHERSRCEGHFDRIWSVHLNPNGKILLSGGQDQTIKLWDLNGHEIRTLRGHYSIVRSVCFSSDSYTIASGSDNGVIKLWGLDGNELKTISGHTAPVRSVCFSPDGQIIASGSEDQTIKLWSVSGEELRTLQGHQAGVLSVCFSSDSYTIASGSDNGVIKLWGLDGNELKTISGHTAPVRSVCFSPDGQIIASGSEDQTIKLWSVSGEELRTLQGHQAGVLSVCFSPNNKLLASGSADRTVKVWSLLGEGIQTFRGHQDWVRSICFHPAGDSVASGSGDQTIKLWMLKNRDLQVLSGHQDRVRSVCFSSNGRTIASSSDDQTIRLWSFDDGEIFTWQGHAGKIWRINFNSEGNLLATAGEDGLVKIWSLTGTELQCLSGHLDRVVNVCFSPNQDIIASSGDDLTIRIWDLDGKELQIFEGHTDFVRGLCFSPDGKFLLSSSEDQTIRLWNLNGDVLRVFRGHRGWIRNVCFSPDGKTVASCGQDQTIRLWSLEGIELQVLRGHRTTVRDICFSPDGQLIASASADKTVKLWSLEGNELITLEGHHARVLSVCFSPDGKTIASGSQDQTIMLWSLDLDNLLALGQNWLKKI